jgi:hypothetical protein
VVYVPSGDYIWPLSAALLPDIDFFIKLFSRAVNNTATPGFRVCVRNQLGRARFYKLPKNSAQVPQESLS